MSDDLIARLRAAHEAATPAPLRVQREIGGYEWVFDARDECVMEGESGDLAAYVLVRNALPEIIAVLEAGRALDAAWSDAVDAMDDDNIIPTELWGGWMFAHRCFRDALGALEPES